MREATKEMTLHISLTGTDPLVWRRVRVPADLPLYELHCIIQMAMGWEMSHLHEFICGDRHFSDPEFQLENERMEDEDEVTLAELLKRRGDRLTYIYDFGDGWQHEVRLEQTGSMNPEAPAPFLIDGANACPPEDCGGVGGFADYCAIMRDPQHPEHEEMLEWNGPYLPEHFDRRVVDRLFFFRYHV